MRPMIRFTVNKWKATPWEVKGEGTSADFTVQSTLYMIVNINNAMLLISLYIPSTFLYI